MQFAGMIVGLATFFIIGALHPVIIKAEFHLGKGCWPLFLVGGLGCLAGSLAPSPWWASALLAVLGCNLLWCIKELFDQEKRVQKGWFPGNPKRLPPGTPQTHSGAHTAPPAPQA